MHLLRKRNIVLGSIAPALIAVLVLTSWGKAETPASAASKPATASKPASKPAGASAPAANVLLADCVSWKDKKITARFHQDAAFDKYIASQFKYPKQEGGMKNGKVGQVCVVTFVEEMAAHVVKSSQFFDSADKAPNPIPDRTLVGKVVATDEKNVFVEWKQDDATRKFFAKEHIFGVSREGVEFTAGQVVRFVFGADNRHCSPYPLDKKK